MLGGGRVRGRLAGGLRDRLVEVVCEGGTPQGHLLPTGDGPPTDLCPFKSHNLLPLGDHGLGQGRGLTAPPVAQSLIISPCQALAHSPAFDDDMTTERIFLFRIPLL